MSILVGMCYFALMDSPSLNAQMPSPQPKETPTPEPVSTFFRMVEFPSKALASGNVNIRTEPSLSSEIVRQARDGNKFRIRQGVEWIEADGDTWVPIVAGSQRAWIALSRVEFEYEATQVPVSAEEVAQVYYAALPPGAISVIAHEDQLLAIDAHGHTIAVWDWGSTVGQGWWEVKAVPEFFRTVQVPKIRVIASVRVRTEPSTSKGTETVLRTAQVGEVFDIRQDEEMVEADGYAWTPVIVDGENAWIARDGFLEQITEQYYISIGQDEIEAAYTAPLPDGATETVVGYHEFYAINEEGKFVAIWNWGDSVGQGRWDLSRFSENAKLVSPSGKLQVNYSNSFLFEIGVTGIQAQSEVLAALERLLINDTYATAQRTPGQTIRLSPPKGIHRDQSIGTIEGVLEAIEVSVLTEEEFLEILTNLEESGIKMAVYIYDNIPRSTMYFDINDATLLHFVVNARGQKRTEDMMVIGYGFAAPYMDLIPAARVGQRLGIIGFSYSNTPVWRIAGWSQEKGFDNIQIKATYLHH